MIQSRKFFILEHVANKDYIPNLKIPNLKIVKSGCRNTLERTRNSTNQANLCLTIGVFG
jgi:hypothetical protein